MPDILSDVITLCLMQLDIPFSEAFYKWMLGMESTFTAQDLQVRGVAMLNRGVAASTTIQCTQHVDPVMARSFAQLAEVAVKKHNLERDSLLVSHCRILSVITLCDDNRVVRH